MEKLERVLYEIDDLIYDLAEDRSVNGPVEETHKPVTPMAKIEKFLSNYKIQYKSSSDIREGWPIFINYTFMSSDWYIGLTLNHEMGTALYTAINRSTSNTSITSGEKSVDDILSELKKYITKKGKRNNE